jgi:uncharacterized membrane protein YkoI
MIFRISITSTNPKEPRMRFDRTLMSVLCAAVLVSPCYAERRQDDASNPTRDPSWSETESRTNSGSGKSKCGISESAGKIRIDSKKGKGGSAAYQSVWSVDWTDSFVIEFEHELKSSRPTKTSQSATSGLALGFGTFDAASGWTDGVNVVVSRTKSARTVTATVRVGGLQVDSQTVTLATGAHDFKLVWTSLVNGAVSMAVQLDGFSSPLLTLSGLESRFAAHTAQGMRVSMFGTSAGNFKFEASFDDFSFSGDDYNDPDDSDFDDDDGDDDADEDGDRDGDDSTAAADFNAALDAIFVASNLPLLEAEADFQSGVSVVKALQWNASNGNLVQVVVNTDGEILRNITWTPTAAQSDKYEDSISVIGSIQLSATAAVSQALVSYPGATVHAIELEEEEGSPQWQIELVDASGFEHEVRILAD